MGRSDLHLNFVVNLEEHFANARINNWTVRKVDTVCFEPPHQSVVVVILEGDVIQSDRIVPRNIIAF